MFRVLGFFEGCCLVDLGEFMWWVFYCGCMDFIEVEGFVDLIVVEMESQCKQVVCQMGGVFGKFYDSWWLCFIQMWVMIEVDFDFVDEEDVFGSVVDEVWEEVVGFYCEIFDYFDQFCSGE